VLPPGPPPHPTVTFLDVGQGDAVLLREPAGATVLIDGGSDPQVLLDALHRHGVGRLELVVASHGDADHVGGFIELERHVDIGRFWVPADQAVSSLLDEIVAGMERAGVPVDAVSASEEARLGEFELSVLGPKRRYAAENDGSVVLWVEAGDTSVLLPGDIGEIAQRDLGPVQPDVLLVPHHGAATTDLVWLADTLGSVAVISVGVNTYGHPDQGVLDTIARSAVSLVTTLEGGDVSVPMN
jgi:beta-lactamase superfamily II metal-dependent hydrolase